MNEQKSDYQGYFWSMAESVKYFGTYTDNFGTTEIVIENNFENLTIEIDGVKFIGYEFSSLAIADKSQYSEQQLGRFTLRTKSKYLCNCSFRFTIDVILIDKIGNEEIANELIIQYELGKEQKNSREGLDFEKVKLILSVEQSEFVGEGNHFETAFDEIQRQFNNRYCFKNCYGCMYGDYSVYGQSGFGTMRCYVSQKEKYLKVRNKQEYMELSDDYKQVQEIYCCEKYEIRKVGVGYRG
ncbi:MAG: DUF6304 family protein [Flammeovirgaceae bacterium]|nr:DUF6304 family protein [Flammeovirgaceae bacterium]